MNMFARSVDKMTNVWYPSHRQTSRTATSVGASCIARSVSRAMFGPQARRGSENVAKVPRGWKHVVEPYQVNPDISVVYELDFNNDVIKPGDKIKFKNIRGTFTFSRLAHNRVLDSTWIDCVDDKTKETRSFHLAKLKMVIRPKRSRRKKVATG